MIITFIIEAVISCILFTLLIIPYLLKDPLAWFYDYPVEVQERIRSLSQYDGKIPTKKDSDMKKKLPVFVVCLVIFVAITYYSGATTFNSAFIYVYLLWTFVNFYDALVLDTIYFCHSKKVRLPGTEDMVKEYENPKIHWIAFFKGSMIGIAFASLVGGLIVLIPLIMLT
ncbi:hypothetical protein [Clostridium estertheticum]|uniref:hypothetical protein n=1 Tax=Clostridium estertheticum TaxID=238834 RepID=UPI001CF4F530|nr:hypothetical protein [Clostridium estertheticum]MCB2356107.1 hypothetical protein [Clostridium estertheticum]WAG43742.1 hypothetical protein LL065_23975 [Clostridium estertheticum]